MITWHCIFFFFYFLFIFCGNMLQIYYRYLNAQRKIRNKKCLETPGTYLISYYFFQGGGLCVWGLTRTLCVRRRPINTAKMSVNCNGVWKTKQQPINRNEPRRKRRERGGEVARGPPWCLAACPGSPPPLPPTIHTPVWKLNGGNSWIRSQSFHLLTSAGQTAAVQGVKRVGEGTDWKLREKQQRQMRLQRKTNYGQMLTGVSSFQQFATSCFVAMLSNILVDCSSVAPSSFIIAIGFFLVFWNTPFQN